MGALLCGVRDTDPLVRASCLSNLGDVCKLLRFSIRSVIHEVGFFNGSITNFSRVIFYFSDLKKIVLAVGLFCRVSEMKSYSNWQLKLILAPRLLPATLILTVPPIMLALTSWGFIVSQPAVSNLFYRLCINAFHLR